MPERVINSNDFVKFHRTKMKRELFAIGIERDGTVNKLLLAVLNTGRGEFDACTGCVADDRREFVELE